MAPLLSSHRRPDPTQSPLTYQRRRSNNSSNRAATEQQQSSNKSNNNSNNSNNNNSNSNNSNNTATATTAASIQLPLHQGPTCGQYTEEGPPSRCRFWMEATDVMWTATWGSFTRLPLSQGISNAGSVMSWFAPDDVKKRWGCTVSHCQSQRGRGGGERVDARIKTPRCKRQRHKVA